MEDFSDSPAADAVLIGCAQAIEHYEIARYGTLKTWAMQLGLDKAADLLDETLEEEKKTNQLLTEIAGRLNAEAVDAVGDTDDEEPAPTKKGKGAK